MKRKLMVILLSCLFVSGMIAQNSVSVGAGSYAEYPPNSVRDEGAYFGLTYTQLTDGWPWHIHASKQDQPIPTNDWWTATIFEQYTGNLEVYPQRVEGTANGIKVSLPTSYAMFDARGLSVTMGTSVTVKGAVEVQQNGDTEIFEDFESQSYPAGWTYTGDLPYTGPVSLADIQQSPTPQGFLGDRFIDSYAGDGPQMTLTSPAFTINKNYIHFLLAGGNDIDLNYVGLYINGERVLAETGEQSATLVWKKFDVSAYQGQTAELRIVDASSGGWGFTICDNIVFSNLADVTSAFSNSFWPQDAKALDWSDLGFTFRLEDDQNHYMDGSVFHGVPYTFIDLNQVSPIVESSSVTSNVYDANGAVISSFPYNGNTVILEVDGKLFGLHAPNGSTFEKSPAGNFIPVIPAGAPKYLVVSVIPNTSLIAQYNSLARNKITKSTFGWNYNVAAGKIETSFGFDAVNYESNATNQQTLLALQPHHYRNTTGHSLIAGADYETMYGTMHTMQGNNITLSYDFAGMTPYMPKPLNLDAAQEQRLNDLLSIRIDVSADYNGNTYAKGFGEETNIMLMAKELGHPGYETIKNNIKSELINWLTYDPAEATNGSYFFAEYPNFGALIGFPVGFGSQAFNDLHFHYGYFITGAARLMMVDEDFKNQYGDMVKRVAKSYANWKRFGVNDSEKQPFLRNFDPYVGHSWAGGIGSGVDGNNQESTSEAMHSWFGMYLLGVALEDQEIMSLGATGFMLEGTTTQDYWFNREGDMPEEYTFDYVGILKANNMAMATFFDGDPAWAFGIQAVPCDFFYTYYLGKDATKAASDWSSMLDDRVNFDEMPSNDPYTNVAEMGAYLGNYHLNYVQSYDPAYAANMLDQLITNEGGDWETHVNSATNYYVANAMVSYGKPAAGYRTSIATGGVFENENGELAILLYNNSSVSKDVVVYQNNAAIQTITVAPKQYYNSKLGVQPLACSASADESNIANNKVTLNATSTIGGSTFAWTQVSGPAATIASVNNASTLVTLTTNGTYTFEVVVSSASEQCTSTTSVTLESIPQECMLISQGKTATGSSMEGDYAATNAVDGDLNTRWSSEFADPQWVVVDLEDAFSICAISINWEGASGKAYEIQLSNDVNFGSYDVIAAETNGDGGIDSLATDDSKTGRYVRFYGTERNTDWGYSIWEMNIYGSQKLNIAPEANAGSDKNITLLVNQVTLTGSGSDEDGTVVSYYWEVVSGGAANIESPNNASTVVSGLTEGTFTLQLTVTDNNGATDTDQVLITVTKPDEDCNLISLGKTAIASSYEGDYIGQNAVDGDVNTRWSSEFSDPQWLSIDLGDSYSICAIGINWEGAAGKAYEIQLSNDANFSTYEVIASETNGDGGMDSLITNNSVSGQYIRLYGTERTTGWGYSIWEFNVYGSPAVIITPEPCHVISENATVYTSSAIGDFTGAMVVDGNIETRWESEYTDPQWIAFDFGEPFYICSVDIDWETAFGKAYEIQLSDDINFGSYTVIASETNGDGGHDAITTSKSVKGQYMRLYGTERNTGYGYSIFEMVVQGTRQPDAGDSEAPSAPGHVGASPAQYACFLSWTASTDNVGVTEYKVYKGTELEATVDAPNTSMTISGLVPDTDYIFSVYALDAAGNQSEPSSIVAHTEAMVVDTSAIYGLGNIALSMPVEHSSVVTEGASPGTNVTDGDLTSRWESGFSDEEWVTVDLGLRYYIGRVILHWEVASGKHYQIQVSDDQLTWTTIGEFNPDEELELVPRTDDFLTTVGTGRYVRMQGIERNSPWGWSLFEFEIYSPGSGPDDIPDPNPNPNPDPVPPAPSSFGINSPTNGVVITDTRRPTLNWAAVNGATRYEVWVNITKTDYDWFKWGSLLDRFTKVGEVTGTEFTLQEDLVDRWTYKWYIAAITNDGTDYSDVGVFSVYLPVVEQYNDGVNLINGRRDLNKDNSIQPYEDWSQPIDTRVSDLMSRMTLEEKAYQMFYNAQAFPQAGWAFGPGTVDDMFNKQKTSAGTRLGIPFVSAGDCIHGYGTTYPTQAGLAASRNLEITRQCGDMHREEQKAVGMRGSLSPLAEVGTKVMYPRIQEGCGEDAEFAAAQVRAMVCGMQAGPELNPNSVMVTTKHWPGEGAGGEALIVYDGITIKYHMKPWFANVDAGAGSVMPGYAGSSFIDPGGPGAGDSKPILDYLRDVVKFDGVICTDWLPYSAWANSALAGADIMGGSDPGAEGFSMAEFINTVGEARINEACERILQTKFRLGVFEEPYGDPVEGPNTWYTTKHENIAIDAARQSMTLLENNGVLPFSLNSGEQLLVTGSRADDGIGHSIWTSYFHKDAGAKTMYEAIKEKAADRGIETFLDEAPNPSAAVVVIGEPSYTHRTSWEKEQPWVHDAYFAISDTYEYDSTLLQEVEAMGIPYVVVVVMPRPYILTDVKDMADALMAVYRPGDGGGPALAQILFGEYEPKGKLPWQLPRSMDQVGTDLVSGQIEKWDLPFDLGATAAERQEIRAKIAANEEILPIYGDPLYQYGYGIQGFGDNIKEGSMAMGNTNIKESRLVIYPNPVADEFKFFIQGVEDQDCFISIKELSGKIVIAESIQCNEPIDVSSLQVGAYIITISNASFTESKILIKN